MEIPTDVLKREVQDALNLIKPILKPILENIIIPWIKKRVESNNYDETSLEIEDNSSTIDLFEKYLARTYYYCQNVNILIFQNMQIKIEQIYHPMKVKNLQDEHEINISSDYKHVVSNFQKIVISDTAGMGKSTLVKWIGKESILSEIYIPIIIELRNLKFDNLIFDEICAQFGSQVLDFDRNIIEEFLKSGNTLIILDGLDEVENKSRDAVLRNMREFINYYNNTLYILTSRPDNAIPFFNDFKIFNIVPLNPAEAFSLINKYDSISNIKIAPKLIYDLQNNLALTEELLGNPFLVSLLYSTYLYNNEISTSKISFYEEIYLALYKRHDSSKAGWAREKKSKLDILPFKILLRQLAYDTAKMNRVSFSETELLEFINLAQSKTPGININPQFFLEDILSAVPLFQQEGLRIRWAHKSLQDYFAADYIANNSKKEFILEQVYNKSLSSFENILDLFYELDYKTFRKILIKKMLTNFIEHFKSTYNGFPNIRVEDVAMRKSVSFGMKTFLGNIKNNSQPNDPLRDPLPENVEESVIMYEIRNRRFGATLNFNDTIITILHRKNSDLVKFISHDNVLHKFGEILPYEGIFEVDDNPNSIINNSANFKNTTTHMEMMLQLFGSGNYLDYDKSIKELEKIKNDEIKDTMDEIF